MRVRTGGHPKQQAKALAPLYAKTGKPLGGKRRTAGLTLRATDADWTHDEGPDVAGPCLELIRSMIGPQ